MAISQKLIYVDTKTIFSNKLSNGEILNNSIVFIKDTGEIWTHGKYFGLSSASLNNYVTLNTDQTITGKKTIEELSINKDDENITPGSVFVRNSSDNIIRRISWSNFRNKLSDLTVANANKWTNGITLSIGRIWNTLDGTSDLTYTLPDIGTQEVIYHYLGKDSNTLDNTIYGNAIGYTITDTDSSQQFYCCDTKFYMSVGTDQIRTQMACGLYHDNIAMRRYADGKWSSWKSVAFVDDIPSSTDFVKSNTIANYYTLGLLKPRKSYSGSATFANSPTVSSSSPVISAITTTTGRYYAVEMDKDGFPFVNVPWISSTNTDYRVSSNHTTSKIYLVGTLSQNTSSSLGAEGYSNFGVYANDGYLYSGSTKVKVITDNYIYCKDTRNDDSLPGEYTLGLSCDFKYQKSLGIAATGYCSLLTLKGWNDDSGGLIHQLAFDSNGIKYRKSSSDWSAWGDWESLPTGDFLPLSGGTMTGQINSRTIVPVSNIAYNLGSNSNKWLTVYARNIGNVSYPTPYIYADYIVATDIIRPQSSNSSDVGSSSYYFRNVYAYGFKRSGSSDSYVLLGGGGHKALSEFSNPRGQEFYSVLSPGNVNSYGIICNKTWKNDWFRFVSTFLVQGGFGSGILYIEMYGNGTSVYSANAQYSGSITKSLAGVQNIDHYIKIYYNSSSRNFRIYYNYYNDQAVRVSELYTVGSDLKIDDFSAPSAMTSLPTSGYINIHIDSLVESSINITAPAFYESSDKGLKENIKSINSIDYSKLKNIDLKEFNFKKDSTKKYGVIAQDLEEVGLGNLVQGEEGSKSVDYISLLILEVQRLRNEIENIKKQIPTNILNVKGS